MPGPFEAWLLQRGMRTLFLRVRRASQTALELATHFAGHPALSAVLYPGLPGHPGHQIAARQMRGGFGGMLSIRLAGGAGQAQAVLREVRVFKRATSLGGVESLIEHRRGSEGPSSPVPDDLLRLSIGIEDPVDLIADLDAALAAAISPATAPGGRGARRGGRPVTGLAAKVTAALERSVLPSVIARGGAVRVAAAADGVVTLEVDRIARGGVPAGLTDRGAAACCRPRDHGRHGSSPRERPGHRPGLPPVLPRPPAVSWTARSTR